MEFYKDQNRTFEERAADLVSKMTLEEKIMQVGNNASAIPRLNLPHYDYWSEASHGFFGPFETKEMDVTSYPVCLAMSQSWDKEKIKKVTQAISDECRAHHNLNDVELHMWCPTINMALAFTRSYFLEQPKKENDCRKRHLHIGVGRQ